jgi:hypothetical protein
LAYPEVVYKDFHLKANEVKAYCQFQPPKVGKLAYVNLSFKHKNSEHLVFFRVLVTQRECREHILDFKNFLKKSNFVTIREQVSNQEGTRGFFERIKNEKQRKKKVKEETND